MSEVTQSDETDLTGSEEGSDEITEAPDNNALRSYAAILSRGAAQIGGMVSAGANPFFAGLTTGLVTTMSFFAANGQHKKFKRIEELIEKLDDRIEDLDEARLDKEWLGSEEHEDFLRSALEAAGKARTNEQIELYARILTGAAVEELREQHDPQAYIDLLAALNVRQTKLLRIIWKLQADANEQDLDAPSTGISKPWRRRNLTETLPKELHGAVDVALVHLVVQRHLERTTSPGDLRSPISDLRPTSTST